MEIREKKEDNALVLAIPGKVITYNMESKTLGVLCDLGLGSAFPEMENFFNEMENFFKFNELCVAKGKEKEDYTLVAIPRKVITY
ncbi:hypothetical protein RHSIM_Rhsim01G0018200 [Rhododendron simsii]|uniref:Uncharacterized protein n=1 Tax=Rhododendron simsii TaxID=118357 RepID=A0A834LVS1_RHOSS|nr:hypothetical protein RHSIM_Rhsim01G0018200 [Rhododendron simsii]